MSFDLNFLGRVSSTANENTSVIWSYISASDDEATISADGYFNKAMGDLTNGVGRLSVNDVIYSHGTDGHNLLTVTAVVENVITLSYLSNQGELGEWEIVSGNVPYVATQDIYVVAQIILTPPYHDADASIRIETPIGTERAQTSVIVRPSGVFNISNASITFPVRKGDSWKVFEITTDENPSFIVTVIPLLVNN